MTIDLTRDELVTLSRLITRSNITSDDFTRGTSALAKINDLLEKDGAPGKRTRTRKPKGGIFAPDSLFPSGTFDPPGTTTAAATAIGRGDGA